MTLGCKLPSIQFPDERDGDLRLAADVEGCSRSLARVAKARKSWRKKDFVRHDEDISMLVPSGTGTEERRKSLKVMYKIELKTGRRRTVN